MTEYISRKAAIDAISCDITVTGRQNAELVAATIGTFADRIKALPSADVQILSSLLAELTHKERTDRYHVWTTTEVKQWIADKITEMKNDG